MTPTLLSYMIYCALQDPFLTNWKPLGALLSVPKSKLETIESENHSKAKGCCDAMWMEWLRVDPNASWEKLHAIVGVPLVPGD